MTQVWPRIECLVDTSLTASSETLIAHGIHLIAANRLRAHGSQVPQELWIEERASAMHALAVPVLLLKLRSLIEGPMVLLKGPEIAARYPDPGLRPFGDLDILVADSAATYHRLLAAGFVEINDFEFDHTQRPLRWPELPFAIEIHHDLPHQQWVRFPPVTTLLSGAIPSATGIDGISTLSQPIHTLFVAAHAWGHAPLRRLQDLVDLSLMAERQDPDELEALARTFGLVNIWHTSVAASEALLAGDGRRTWPLRLWARHLAPLRDRTVAEQHFARWIGALWAHTLGGKVTGLAATLATDLSPLPGEDWAEKLNRTQRAALNALAPALLRKRDGTPGSNQY